MWWESKQNRKITADPELLMEALAKTAEIAAIAAVTRTLGVVLPLHQVGGSTYRHKPVSAAFSEELNTDDQAGWLTMLVWKEKGSHWALQRKRKEETGNVRVTLGS